MHSGNARIHGMVCISLPLIAYIATQVYCLNFVSYSSYIPDYRLGLPSVPPQSFPGQILQLTQKCFTTLFSTFLMTLMRKKKSMISLFGGIGQLTNLLCLNFLC